MTVYNFPFTSTSPGNAGPYSAELFRSWVETLMTGKNRANAGVLLLSGDGVDDPLEVQQTSPASAQVLVKPGAALVDGCWYYHDADETVAIAANTSGNPRIDYIILRLNATAQTITLVDLQGTPAGSPVPPTLTQTAAQYEIPLAEIEVDNLFTTIVTADIDNTVRTYAREWQRQEGGIAPLDYLDDEFLIGVGAANGVPVKARLDHSRVLLTHVPGGARATNNVSVAAAFQTVPLTVVENNALGYISLASNQINIDEAGAYLFMGGFVSLVPQATAGFLEFRLRNVTQSTTITLSLTAVFNATAGAAYDFWIPPAYFEANTNDKLELQVDGSVTATITYGSTVAAAITGDSRDIVLDFMRVRPLS